MALMLTLLTDWLITISNRPLNWRYAGRFDSILLSEVSCENKINPIIRLEKLELGGKIQTIKLDTKKPLSRNHKPQALLHWRAFRHPQVHWSYVLYTVSTVSIDLSKECIDCPNFENHRCRIPLSSKLFMYHQPLPVDFTVVDNLKIFVDWMKKWFNEDNEWKEFLH